MARRWQPKFVHPLLGYGIILSYHSWYFSEEVTTPIFAYLPASWEDAIDKMEEIAVVARESRGTEHPFAAPLSRLVGSNKLPIWSYLYKTQVLFKSNAQRWTNAGKLIEALSKPLLPCCWMGYRKGWWCANMMLVVRGGILYIYIFSLFSNHLANNSLTCPLFPAVYSCFFFLNQEASFTNYLLSALPFQKSDKKSVILQKM